MKKKNIYIYKSVIISNEISRSDRLKPLEANNAMIDQNPENGQRHDRPKPLEETKTPGSGQHHDRPKPLEADNTMTDQNAWKRPTP